MPVARYPERPQLGIQTKNVRGQRTERTERKPTYAYQLEPFRNAIQHGTEVETNCATAVRQLQPLDAIYGAAGCSHAREKKLSYTELPRHPDSNISRNSERS